MFSFTLVALGMLSSAQDKPSPPPDAPCVAIVLPSVEGVDDTTTVAVSVRSLFQSYLTGPTLRSIALDAKLASQANQEAIQKQCTKVLTVSLTRKAGGNGKSKVATAAQAAGTAAGYIAGGGIGEIAVAGAAAGAQAIGSLASNTRAKDEMRIEYRVTTVDGVQILAPKTDSRKAQSNGEDIVTPLVERAANAIAFVVTKK
jgi:hypothetical protein